LGFRGVDKQGRFHSVDGQFEIKGLINSVSVPRILLAAEGLNGEHASGYRFALRAALRQDRQSESQTRTIPQQPKGRPRIGDLYSGLELPDAENAVRETVSSWPRPSVISSPSCPRRQVIHPPNLKASGICEPNRSNGFIRHAGPCSIVGKSAAEARLYVNRMEITFSISRAGE
jgi:hypothetical protein